MPNEQLDRVEIKVAELGELMNKMYISQEKTRKYLMWTAIITIAAIVLPLLVLPLLLPAFLSSVALPAGF